MRVDVEIQGGLQARRNDVVGDPGSWARALADIDAVRGATRGRGAHVVLAVVADTPLGDVPDDRAQLLIRQAGIERKCASQALRPRSHKGHPIMLYAFF